MTHQRPLPIVLEFQRLHHAFGEQKVLHDIHLQVALGEIVALVGGSGCGKSTLLRAIVGTHLPTSGTVAVIKASGQIQKVEGPGRDRGIVFQNYALFEFLTVLENVAFGLMLDETNIPYRLFRWNAWRNKRKAHLERAQQLLNKLGLADAGNKYPGQLSGGMRQRVAIAQALVMEPAVLLLDEPFGALDESTREELQRMLLTLYAENVVAKSQGRPHDMRTLLLVTHELTEAIFCADRILGLSKSWDFANEGYVACPGATVVYDKTCPVFAPDAMKTSERISERRDEILQVVFSGTQTPARTQHINFWEQIEQGLGEGVLRLGS